MCINSFEECGKRNEIFTAGIEKICAESTNYGEAYHEVTSKTVSLINDLGKFAMEHPGHKGDITAMIAKTAAFSISKIGRLHIKEKTGK